MTKLEHRTYIREYMRRWRKLHPKQNYAVVKNWRKKLREKLGEDAFKEWQRGEYQKYRDRILKSEKNRKSQIPKAVRRKADPESTRLRWRRLSSLRRARKRAATIGDLTDIAKVYDRAKWWRQWFAVEVDHIISLARGGTHEAKNLQIIYDFENRRKYARSDYKPRVVFV